MKIHRIILFALIAFPTLLLQSCLKDQEDIFDKPSSQRMEEHIDLVYKTLTSAEYGWVFNMYPDDQQQYGGYTFTCKFTEGEVEVKSELELGTTVTSLYKISRDMGPVLSFDTYNDLIHAFSTPSASSYEADGGEFIFVIDSVSTDLIKLHGIKTGNVMYLTKLTESADAYLQKIDAVQKSMDYKAFNYIDGTDTIPTKLSGHTIQLPNTVDSNAVMQTVPFHFTPEGIQFYEPFQTNGKTLTGFQCTDSESNIYPGMNNTGISLVGVINPLNKQLVTGAWFMSYKDAGTFAQAYLDKVKAGEDKIGEQLRYLIFGSMDLDGSGTRFTSDFGFVFNSSGYGGQLVYNYTLLGDDRISLTFSYKTFGDGSWYYNNADFYYLTGIMGTDVAKTFKLTTDNLKSPSYIIMTDENNPSNVIKLSANMVSLPLDN